MSEVNYYNEFIKQYKEIRKKEENKPKLLLHVCCGACLAYPLIFLSSLFDITIFYSNSNIYPSDEYQKRIYNVRKYVNEINSTLNKKVEVIEDKYDYETFKKELEPFKNQKEGMDRCKICIAKRINSLFEYAKDNDFKYVTTIMSISRNKDAQYINEVGKRIEEKYKKEGYDIEYIYGDFKKNNGQEIGVQIAKKYNIYRQEYCGCEFSLINSKKNEDILYEISVIVPIHNVEKYINECLESLKNQDINVNYEVICLLDNANKEEKEIVNYYVNKYPTIFKKYFLNYGDVSLTRNYGLKVSKGRYLAFCDGDDFVKHNFLSAFYKKAIKNNADIVIGKYFKYFNNKDFRLPIINQIPSFYYVNKKYNVEKTRRRTSMGLRNDTFIRGYMWNKFYKRELIVNNNMFFLSIDVCIEDMFFNYLALLYSKKTVFINDRTYVYRIRENSLVRKDPLKISQKYINTYYLFKYCAIKEFNDKSLGKGPYYRTLFSLIIDGFKYKDQLDVSLFSYIKLVNKQIRKLRKNTYLHEGDEWEKALYLYIKKKGETIY